MPTREPDRSIAGIAPALFREVLGSVPAPVTIVTSLADGHPHGTTVSAFCSLSLDPPLVTVSLDRGSQLLATVRASGRFGVNVLERDQAAHATAFARKTRDKFAGVDWRTDHGLPRLAGAAAWLACRIEAILPGGDHLIVAGLVEHAERTASSPLLYWDQSFVSVPQQAVGE